MKKTTFLTILASLSLGGIYAFQILSTGAPAGHSGAPGDKTCAKSGCHSDLPVVQNSSDIKLEMAGVENGYLPGETYPLKINIKKARLVRYGFQVLVLDSANHNCGEILITDSTRTQVLGRPYNNELRVYLTYTAAGTLTDTPGEINWEAKWKAPSTIKGPVTFYLAGTLTNNDGTDQGDTTILNKFVITPNNQTLVKEIKQDAYALYPNPTKGILHLNTPTTSIYSIQVYTSELKLIKSFLMESHDINSTITLPSELAPGAYYLGINGELNKLKLFIKQ